MTHFLSTVAIGCALSWSSLALAQVDYAYDDGTGNTNIGFNQVADFLWGNVYQTAPGGEVITQISVAFGNIPEGTPVRVMLYDIASGSLNPLSGVKKAVASGFARLPRSNTFITFEIPPVRVSGTFFVGCAAAVDATTIRPARLDGSTASLASRAWVFASSNFDHISTLSAAPFNQSIDTNAVRGTFQVRARGRALNCMVDFDDDGVVSPADLAAYATAFLTEPAMPGPVGLGAAPCAGQPAPYDQLGYAADTNRDCSLDQDDLSLFVTAYFGEVSAPTDCVVAP